MLFIASLIAEASISSISTSRPAQKVSAVHQEWQMLQLNALGRFEDKLPMARQQRWAEASTWHVLHVMCTCWQLILAVIKSLDHKQTLHQRQAS